MTSTMMLSSVISLFVGLVLPALTALVTKEHVSDGLKTFLTAVLAAVSGALSGALTAIPHGWHQWEPIAWNILLAWIAAAVTFLTDYSPLGKISAITRKTARFGIGSSTSPPAQAGYTRLRLLLAGAAIGVGFFLADLTYRDVLLAVIAGIMLACLLAALRLRLQGVRLR